MLTRQKALADFLKVKRAQLQPLNSITRRRTPGLRREEVALRANVSVSWYTWLEQARDVQPSETVLRNIAAALALSEQETTYLLHLAFPKTVAPLSDAVPENTLLVLDALADSPAIVMDAHWRVVAWNQATLKLMPAFAKIDWTQENLLSLMFLNADYRALFDDWATTAHNMVANFRLQFGERVADPWFAEFITTLQAQSAEFSDMWAAQNVHLLPEQNKILHHPTLGTMQFAETNLLIPQHEDLLVHIFTPIQKSLV